jgi:hypothetical protein
MKLNALKVSGKHPKWCGPSALSIITGRTVNYCAKLIADDRNETERWRQRKVTSKMVKGASNDEVIWALQRMGFDAKRVEIKRVPGQGRESQRRLMPTLHRYMRERGGAEWKGVMLVNVTSHYVVIHKDTVSDNHQQDKHYTEHRWRRKKIDKAWLITRRPRRKMA